MSRAPPGWIAPPVVRSSSGDGLEGADDTLISIYSQLFAVHREAFGAVIARNDETPDGGAVVKSFGTARDDATCHSQHPPVA